MTFRPPNHVFTRIRLSSGEYTVPVSVCVRWRYFTNPCGTAARPSEGWSVNMLPVRSTVSTPPRIYMEVHAFNARTVSADSTPASALPLGFFDGSATTPLDGAFRIRRVQATWVACEVLRKSWK